MALLAAISRGCHSLLVFVTLMPEKWNESSTLYSPLLWSIKLASFYYWSKPVPWFACPSLLCHVNTKSRNDIILNVAKFYIWPKGKYSSFPSESTGMQLWKKNKPSIYFFLLIVLITVYLSIVALVFITNTRRPALIPSQNGNS